MMKIMLINPPDAKMIQGAIPKELGSDRMGKYPPLGLLYVASSVKRHLPDIDIHIVDAIADGLSAKQVENKISIFNPDVVGISAYTFTLIDALDAAHRVKQNLPNATVVLGGFHPSIYREESLKCSNDIDIAVAGEAEETFPELLLRLKKKESLKGLCGISYRDEQGNIHVNDETPLVQDLNLLPFPDRSLVNYKKHVCILGSTNLTTNILSSRGCPFQCKYCYVNVRKYRLRSIDNVMEEILECMNLGIHEFFFMDDLFNLTKKRVIDFSDQIIKRGINIQWNFRGRVDQIDDEVLEKARKAGCTRIHYGVESGVPEVLDRIGKGTNLIMVRQALELTKKHDIDASSNIMIGLPGESPARTEQTIRFALDLPTDYLQAAVFMPYPETPLYKEGLDSGLLPRDYWREFALKPKEDFEPLIWSEFYTKEQLFDKLREFYRRFYLRPKFLRHYLRNMTSWHGLRMMFKNGLTLIMLVLKARSHKDDR